MVTVLAPPLLVKRGRGLRLKVDAVYAWCVRNVAFDGVGVGIHDYGLWSRGRCRRGGRRCRRKRSPSFVAGNGNSFDDVVSRRRRALAAARENTAAEKRATRGNVARPSGVRYLRIIFSFLLFRWF